MSDKLPYQLSKGVVAKQHGLVFDGWLVQLFGDPDWLPFGADGYIVSWPDAAERLRYREGEPWCMVSEPSGLFNVSPKAPFCGRPSDRPTDTCYSLHRLAAILCDDAEAFRVLHWCVTEFGDD